MHGGRGAVRRRVPTTRDFAWALLAGLGSGVGTGFLYRGFAAGRMGVVAGLGSRRGRRTGARRHPRQRTAVPGGLDRDRARDAGDLAGGEHPGRAAGTRRRHTWWALLAGPLGASATGALLRASQTGYLTVAGVPASLDPATTVLLATLVLREHVHRAQGVGLGLCVVAIGVVAGG